MGLITLLVYVSIPLPSTGLISTIFHIWTTGLRNKRDIGNSSQEW